MNDLMGIEDVMGDETLTAGEADILGAAAAVLRKRGRPIPRRVFKRPPLAPTPGQPDAKLRSYMGVGIAVWAPADGSDKVLTVEPQETFRGERLLIDILATGGADTGITLVRRIDVGSLAQSPSTEQAAPAAMFRADATYAGLDLQIAYRGMKISVTLGRTAATPAGVTSTASVGLYGEWVR